MPQVNESVEDIVDKLIREREEESIEDFEKRKPKPPFRYLRDKEEIEAVLAEEASVMKRSETLKMVDENLAILGIGDVEAIENVIRRHQISRKFKIR